MTNGSLSLSNNGGFVYTPQAGFVGTDSFQYRAEQDGVHSETVPVTLDVFPVVSIHAVDDHYTIPAGTTELSVSPPGVLANDEGGESANLQVDLEQVTDPSKGDLAMLADGSFTYTLTDPEATSDSFTYVATNGVDHSLPATVLLTVEEGEQPPSEGASFAVSFDDVGRLSLSTFVGKASPSSDPAVQVVSWRLDIGAWGNPAAVSGGGPGLALPAQTNSVLVISSDPRYETATRAAFDDCEKLALLIQARPEKYLFNIAVDLGSASQLAQANGERITVRLPHGHVTCSLRRQGQPSGGG